MRRNRQLGCALVLCLAAFSAVSNAQAQEAYEKFVAVEYKTFKHGSSSLDDQEMRRLRDEFVQTPEPSAKLLIGKVQNLNSEEMKFEESYGSRKESSYVFYLRQQGRSARLKGFLVLLLADLYHHVGSPTRLQILTVIGASFTPSERFFHSNPLDFALARIGKDSVPVWLKLFRSDSESVRCHSAELLSELKEFTGLTPPRIDCRAGLAIREQQASEFSAWWDKSSPGAKWPSVPSMFDELADRENAPVKRGSKKP